MKKLLPLMAFFPALLFAQAIPTSYNFEETTVPKEWTTSEHGKLSITPNHFKEGTQSMCWEVTGEGVLEALTEDRNYNGRTAYMQLRSDKATNDTLVIEFLHSNGRTLRTANVLVNFAGWNEFNRQYAKYSELKTPQIAKVRFTLKPTAEKEPRRIWIDAVDFNSSNTFTSSGALLTLDCAQIGGHQLNLFSNKIDIPVTTPTAEEIAGLNLLRSRFPRYLAPSVGSDGARSFAKSFSITRNPDGSVRGKVMDCSYAALTASYVRNLLGSLERLGIAYSKSPELKTVVDREDSVLFVDLLDHVLDQGFSQGANYGVGSSVYNDAREIPASVFNIASILSGDRREQVLNLGRWLCEYGTAYFPEETYISSLNTDIVYNYLPHQYAFGLLQADDAIAVRELKAMKRYLERYAEVTPGYVDGLKIDGCGFHHSTHYNNYMYAFKSWAQYIHHLRETPFVVDEEGYLGFANAVRSMYLQTTRMLGAGSNSALIYANSLAGRNPYMKGGINLQVPLEDLKNLVNVSREILGNTDPELGAIYNYFSKTKTFNVPEKNFDGYYQFNYSPIGIARKGDWLVTMRAPTTKFWGCEIYNNQNRFGRYQSHGTMEVNYAGPRERSGIPVTTGGAGWDWNIVPGATTIHYSSWVTLNPGEKTATGQRFDQYSVDTNFAGSLSFGNNGIFASDFVQGNSWGAQVFTPTNLKFKKSVFTFDDLFVSLGSNISSVRTNFTDLTTATNLFQEVESSYFERFIVDGKSIDKGTNQNLDLSESGHSFLTPLRTGYYVPRGNDNVVVKFGSQTSPAENGADISNPNTTVTAAKAFINHGAQPSAASYHFVMVPGTTEEKITELASEIGEDGGSIYLIQSQTEKLHAVTHYASHTTGYTFFAPVGGLTFGDVLSTTAEHLLMVTNVPGSNRLEIAATNPDLRPKADKTYGFLSQPTEATITLKGKWLLKSQTPGVKSATIVGNNTELVVVMSEGMPEYITLIDEVAASTPEIAQAAWVTFNESVTDFSLLFDGRIAGSKQIRIFTPDSSLAYQGSATGSKWSLSKSTLRPGIYLLQVAAEGKTKTFKVIVR